MAFSAGRRRATLLVFLVLICRSEETERSRREYRMLVEYERQRLGFRWSPRGPETFADLLVVQTNHSERAKSFCEGYGFAFVRRVFEDDSYFLFQRQERGRRRRRRAPEFDREVARQSEIQWTSRQRPRYRVLRILSAESLRGASERRLVSEFSSLDAERRSNVTPTFNDPLFEEQWYLHNRGQTGAPPRNDINVVPVWQTGVTGRGVAISVLDDGVHARSEEVADNYEPALSEEYLFRKTSLRPISENSHGTRCAAVAAGVANNGVCGVGVAYEASVGGIRILEGPLTDVQEALALVHALDRVDVYTASWGPVDEGQTVDGPRILARLAFVKGVTMGRQGKGSIYVWAAGNGGGYRDNCSLDGYASSPFTLTIGAVTEDGRSTFYSEPCAAVIASTYVGGRSHVTPKDEAWKEDKKRIKVVVPEGKGQCEETFEGTSAAAPMAAGVVALALHANPDLTWRDVQHLIVRTSRVPTPREPGWLTNAAGFRFHPKVGSGILDCHALVTLARSWTPVGSLRVWTTPPDREERPLPPKTLTSVALRISKPSVDPLRRIDRLETVIATVSIRHGHRGDLAAALQSPGGTTSSLLTKRTRDNGTSGFEYWEFASLHFWGEDPEGVWTLRVSNDHPTIEGLLDYFSVTLHGTLEEL